MSVPCGGYGKQPKESVIERYLKKRATDEDFICNKFVSPSNSGVPDRILVGHGIIFFVELKAPGKTLRPLQEHVVNEYRKHGALVFVADTKEAVDEIMSEIKTLYIF